MPKNRWTKEIIIKRIKTLAKLGEPLTCSRVKEIDSVLIGASISHFNSWKKALEAAGFDYSKVRAISSEKRSEKIRKWSVEKILDDIKRIAETEDELSYTFIKEKYPALVAAANNYVGSWKKTLEMMGYNYDEILKTSKNKKMERKKKWYQALLIEKLRNLWKYDEGFSENIWNVKNTYPKFYTILIIHFEDFEVINKKLKKQD